MKNRLKQSILLISLFLVSGSAISQISAISLVNLQYAEVEAGNSISFDSSGNVWVCGGLGAISTGRNDSIATAFKPLGGSEFPPMLDVKAETIRAGFNHFSLLSGNLTYLNNIAFIQNPQTLQVSKLAWSNDLSHCIVYTTASPSRTLGINDDFTGPSNRLFIGDNKATPGVTDLMAGNFSCNKLIFGDKFITCVSADTVYIWQKSNTTNVFSRIPFHGQFSDLAWNADEDRFVLLTDQSAVLYSLASLAKPITLTSPDCFFRKVCFAHNHPVFILTDSEYRLNIWAYDNDVPRLMSQTSMDAAIAGIAVSPQNKLFVSLLNKDNTGEMKIYDLLVK